MYNSLVFLNNQLQIKFPVVSDVISDYYLIFISVLMESEPK
jgi:hypothetical protein